MGTLRMRAPRQFEVSFYRPNLFFRVIEVRDMCVWVGGCWCMVADRRVGRGLGRTPCAHPCAMPRAVLRALMAPQKDYSRSKETGLPAYLEEILLYIQ